MIACGTPLQATSLSFPPPPPSTSNPSITLSSQPLSFLSYPLVYQGSRKQLFSQRATHTTSQPLNKQVSQVASHSAGQLISYHLSIQSVCQPDIKSTSQSVSKSPTHYAVTKSDNQFSNSQLISQLVNQTVTNCWLYLLQYLASQSSNQLYRYST